MSGSLASIVGVLVAEKAPNAVLNYTLDYSGDLVNGATIVSSTWTSDAGPILTGSSFTGTTTTVVIGGGTSGVWYTIENAAISSAGLTHTGTIRLNVIDPALFGANLNLPFPSVLGALASLRRDRLLFVAQNFFPGIIIDDQYLLEKLVAASALIQRELRVYLTPTEILPNTATQAEIDALTQAGNVVQLEPAYDYSPDIFQGNTWGFQPLRQRPIIAVHGMQFVYPTPNATLYAIPSSWIRVDRKYGTINLLPVTSAFSLPLNAFILSALGGGRMVPNFLEIRYRAGLENVARDWPDILDCILKTTVLSIVEDMFIPSSKNESTSADGLSQSTSIGLKMMDYENAITGKMDKIRRALFGVVVGVL